MSSVQNIVDSIHARLTSDTGAGGLANATGGVGSRIYPVEGRQSEPLPHLSFFVVDTSLSQRYMSATSGTPRAIAYEVLVQFDVYADARLGSNVATNIDTKLFDRLDNFTASPTGFDRAVCTFTRRAMQQVEDDAIRLTSEVRIQATDF